MTRINLTRLIRLSNPQPEYRLHGKPFKSLTVGRKRDVGRNNVGKVTTRHKGGGVKRRFRLVELGQGSFTGAVERIEYDPNRSVYIALLTCTDGKHRYILAPYTVSVGQEITWGESGAAKLGNRMPISQIPVGTMVHNVEFSPHSRAGFARSAGNSAEFLNKEGSYAQLKLPSGEIRRVDVRCYASIGQLSRIHHHQEVIVKAGRVRLRGIRPTVRGAAMSPYAHPHGGGEGKAGVGMPGPKTKWGKLARGVRTRAKRKYSDRVIVTHRER